MDRCDSQIAHLLITECNQVHHNVDFLLRKPAHLLLPFLQVTVQIALVAVLSGQHRLSPESLIIVNPAQEAAALRHVGVLDCSKFLEIGFDLPWLRFKHLDIRDDEADELAVFETQSKVVALFIVVVVFSCCFGGSEYQVFLQEGLGDQGTFGLDVGLGLSLDWEA